VRRSGNVAWRESILSQNNKIKTIRRQDYGYPDDEYFFLKIIDGSRKRYVRNPKSHRFCD
jgi:hypothetical protein